MKYFWLLTFPLLTVAYIAFAQSPMSGSGEGSSPIQGGGSLSSDPTPKLSAPLLTSGWSMVNDIALTGDVAPVAAYEDLGGNASPFAVTAGSQAGAASTYRGGCGTTNIKAVTCSAAGAGATVTLSGYKADSTTWTETYTEGAGGALGWARGASEAACATNLAATISAAPIASLYVTASAAGAAGVFVGIAVKPGMNAGCPTIATNAAVGVLLPVNGVDGKLLIPPGAAGFGGPGLAGLLYPGNGFDMSRAGYVDLYLNNALAIQLGGPGSVGSIYAYGSITGQTGVTSSTSVFTGKSLLPSVSAAATDVAPPTMVISTEEPYAATPPTTIPTSSSGANLVAAPGNGARRLGGTAGTGMCTATPCVFAAGQTITIPVQVDGVSTNCVITSAADTTAATMHAIIDGVTPAVAGSNIVTAASTVSPCSLLTVTAANNVVSFARKSGLTSYIGPVVSSAGGVTAQNGLDGSWKAPVRVVAGANTACNTTCGAGRGCLFGQDTAALSYAIVGCADATADLCICTAAY